MQVIFDTNAYRNLTRGVSTSESLEIMRQIRATESEKGINAFASPVVWLELFVHLADPKDPHFSECLGAVLASFLHTRGTDGLAFQMVQWPFVIVGQTVFGIPNRDLERQLASMDQMVGSIYQDPTLETLARFKGPLTDFKRYAEAQEQGFMRRFKEVQEVFWMDYSGEKGLIKAMRGQEFLNRLAFYELLNASSGVGVDLMVIENSEFERYFQIVKDYFSAPLWLFIEMMSRMVSNKAFDISKGSRRNWYWAYQMLFHVSNHTSFFLITDDGDIRDAAKMAGAGDRVLTLDQYLGFLRAPLSQTMESRVVRISVPAGQEVDMTGIAERLGLSEEEVEKMRLEVKEAPGKLREMKAAVLAQIQPFYDEAVARWGVESNKVKEILDVGKFIHFNKLRLQLLKVGESPDFILEFEGSRVGLEHTQLFDEAEQHRVGKVSSLLEEARKHIVSVAPEILGLFNVAVDTEKIFENGRSFIDLPKVDLRTVARELGEYLVSFARGGTGVQPIFVEGVKSYDQESLSLSPLEDFIRRGIDRDAFVKRIAEKEAKVERYKKNSGLSACWLLVVYVSAVSSTSFHVGLEDMPTDRVIFDRIFLMDSFTGNIIEGRLHG